MDGGSWTDHTAMGEKPQCMLYHVKPCCSYVYILCRVVVSIADLLSSGKLELGLEPECRVARNRLYTHDFAVFTVRGASQWGTGD